MTLTMGF